MYYCVEFGLLLLKREEKIHIKCLRNFMISAADVLAIPNNMYPRSSRMHLSNHTPHAIST